MCTKVCNHTDKWYNIGTHSSVVLYKFSMLNCFPYTVSVCLLMTTVIM